MNIKKKVTKILSALSSEETIENESTLKDDLALDSLSMVTLLVEIEETFGIKLDESDMNPFDLANVWQVVDLVEKYAGGENNEENEKED